MAQIINFDANASYGLTPYVAEGLSQLGLNHFNPNSIHQGGQQARALIEQARENIAKLIGVGQDSRIVFTSGATEANNTALRIPFSFSGKTAVKNQLVISAIEHPSIRETARALSLRGVSFVELSYDANSGVAIEELLRTVTPETTLASLMWVNNETGEILPIPQMVSALRLHSPRTLVHSDAVQALGKLKIDFERSGLDMLSISAHKIGGLCGVGALVVGRRVAYEPLLYGGAQELHHRAGTENVLGIVSFGLAAKELIEQFELREKNTRECRALIIEGLIREIPDLSINTPLDRSVSNTLSLRVPQIRADDLVVALDRTGFLVSSGAACASGKPEPSPVLRAYGLNEHEAKESIRISLRGDCTILEARQFIEQFITTVKWMHQSYQRAGGM